MILEDACLDRLKSRYRTMKVTLLRRLQIPQSSELRLIYQTPPLLPPIRYRSNSAPSRALTSMPPQGHVFPYRVPCISQAGQ